MIDLYDKHDDPESLLWYKHHRMLPWNILDDIKGGVKPTPMQKKVLYRSPLWAYKLAVQRDTRITEAEPYIKQDGEWAFWYAVDVIADRWPEAEPAILRHCKEEGNFYNVIYYSRMCIRGRWHEAEKLLIDHGGFYSIGQYADNFNLRLETLESGETVFVEKWGMQEDDEVVG